MPLVTVSTLLDSLRQYRFLEPAQLEQLAGVSADLADPRVLARHLLDRSWLTPFQINHLLQGGGAELFLGAYVIQERLGEGGTGQVYKALHQRMRRVVALKVIRRELLADAEVVARFYREIQVASQVAHPNVVHAYDAGPIGDRHFLAMEYVKGIDLARLIKKNGPVPVAQACDYIRQAALGLQHIHENGLVHRDVKPSNLLVMGDDWQLAGKEPPATMRGTATQPALASTRWGIIKILDLGLARFQRPLDGDLTGSFSPVGGVTMGTPDYMGPEQAIDLHLADIRSDIYSLGCTLYYLLAGQPPFPGGTLAQKLLRHQQAQPSALAELCPAVPAGLVPIAVKMLAKNQDDRFQTPAELVGALDALLVQNHQSTVTRPDDVIQPLPDANELAQITNAVGVLPLSAEAAAVPIASPVDEDGAPSSVAGSFDATPAPTANPAPEAEAPSLAAIQALDDIILDPTAIPSLELASTSAAIPMSLVNMISAPVAIQAADNGPIPVASVAPEDAGPPAAAILLGDAPNVPPRIAPVAQFLTTDATDILATAAVPLRSPRRRRWLALGAATLILFVCLGGGFALFKGSPPASHSSLGKKETTRDTVKSARSVFDLLDPARIPPEERFDGQPKALVAVLGERRMRHWGQVHAVGFRPDGQTLFSFGSDQIVRVWNLSDGQEHRRFPVQSSWITPVVSPDGRSVLAGSADFTVKLWDMAGKEKMVFKGHQGEILSVAFAPDGASVASMSRDNTIKVWNPSDGALRATIPRDPQGPSSLLALSPDGKYLIQVGTNFTLKVWDIAAAKELTVFDQHKAAINSIRVAPDNQTVVSTSQDQTVRQWELATGKIKLDLKAKVGFPTSAIFSPDNKFLAVGSVNGAINILNLVEKKDALAFPSQLGSIVALAYSTDGKTLAAGSLDGTVRVWDTATGNPLIRLEGHPAGVQVMAIAADGKTLVSSCGDRMVHLWDLTTAKERTVPVTAPELGRDGAIHALSLSPGGSQPLATGQPALGIVRLWNTTTGKEQRILWRSSGIRISDVSFNQSGTVLGVGMDDSTVKLLDAATGKELHTLKGHTDKITAVMFAPDDKSLATSSFDGSVRLWDANTGQPRGVLQGNFGKVHGVVYSPDGKTLATVGEDPFIHLWDVATEKERGTLPGHASRVTSLAYPPTGRNILASTGLDGRIMVWDTDSKNRLHEWLSPGPVFSVFFAPDGRHIATGNSNGTIYILRLSPPPK